MIQYTLVNPVPKKSYHHSGPSPVRQNKLRICQDKGAARAKDIWISTALVVGPFEKEKEGIGIACDVIKVKGKEGSGHPWFSKGGQGEVACWRSISWVRAPWPTFEETSGP